MERNKNEGCDSSHWVGLCIETRCPWGNLPQSLCRERERKEQAGHTGREESLAGLWNTVSPSFSIRLQKNPGSMWLLNGLMQQHKHTPVAVKGPSLQSHRPARHT